MPPPWWGFTSSRDKDRLEKLIGRLQRGGFLPDDGLFFADLAANADRRLFRPLVSNPSHGPMVSPSQKRILVILSLGCFLKGFIVRNFLVWGLPGFLTYLRFVYIFANSLYSKFY